MEKSNIAMIGFMGSGKTMISLRLGKLFNKVVISTDEEIERQEKRSILEIFTKSGEQYFREVEKKVVRDIASRENLIIDCGGGVVVDQVNIDQLKKSSVLIYFSASPELLYKQVIGRKHRPLLNVDDPLARIKDMLAERLPMYEQADFTIDTNQKTIEEISQEVTKLISYD